MRGRPKQENAYQALLRSLEEKRAFRDKRRKSVSLTLPTTVIERLDELAEELTAGNRSELVEEAIIAFIKEVDKDRKKTEKR